MNTKTNETNLAQALLAMNEKMVEAIISNSNKIDPTLKTTGTLISKAFVQINNAWEDGSVSLSQVYLSATLCERLLEGVKCNNITLRNYNKKVGIAVFQDFHLLGKKIVYSTLRANGIDIIDLGDGLSTDEVIAQVKLNHIDILLISVLMLPSALKVKDLKTALTELNVKLIVGGAPFRLDPNLRYEVEADYFCSDSSEALTCVTDLLTKN